MQDHQRMSDMMRDLIQYIMIPRIRYDAGIGTYASYDIAAYDCLTATLAEIVWDVTPDRELALRMVERFNRYRLEPCHLLDAVCDMLD